jgi:telomere length regulation protein
LFFKQITIQLLLLAEERDANVLDKETFFNKNEMGAALLFVGETYSRICRRGSAGN